MLSRNCILNYEWSIDNERVRNCSDETVSSVHNCLDTDSRESKSRALEKRRAHPEGVSGAVRRHSRAAHQWNSSSVLGEAIRRGGRLVQPYAKEKELGGVHVRVYLPNRTYEDAIMIREVSELGYRPGPCEYCGSPAGSTRFRLRFRDGRVERICVTCKGFRVQKVDSNEPAN